MRDVYLHSVDGRLVASYAPDSIEDDNAEADERAREAERAELIDDVLDDDPDCNAGTDYTANPDDDEDATRGYSIACEHCGRVGSHASWCYVRREAGV